MNSTETLETVATFALIDYGILFLVMAASLAVGVYFAFFSKGLKTTEDYLVGGHKMKPFPVAVSLMASQLSAIAIVTIPAEVYSFGWQNMLTLPAIIFVILLTNYISLPVFYSNNIENCYVYLEMRFGRATRKILTTLFIAMLCIFSPVIMYIPSLALAEVTKYNVQMINIIVSYICVIYVMLGGIKAVVYTDVLQAFVMIASITIVAVLGIMKTGGIVEVWDRAVEGGRIFPPIMSMDLTTRITFWNTIISVLVVWACNISFSQNCAQRLISLPTLRSAKKSMIIFLIGVVFIMGINIGTGIIMYSYYHGCDPVKAGIVRRPDNLIPRFVQDVAGHIPGMPGIFISCVFSASLSCVSAGIHAVSGVVYSDYVRPLKLFAHTDFNANFAMRVIIIALGTICAFGGIIVERFSSIFQICVTVTGVTTGAKFGVFTIGMLYPWANQKGVLTGITISVATLAIIIINSQMHHLRYTPIATTIDQCSNETLAQISHSNTSAIFNEQDDGFAFYKISFQWYSVIGAVLTWIPTIIVSYFTGGPDMTKFNIKLFAPFVQKMFLAKYRLDELKTVVEEDLYPDKLMDEKASKQERTVLMTGNDDHQNEKC